MKYMGEAFEDRSLVILADGQPVGVAPLVIRKLELGERAMKEVAYRNTPLPWPFFIDSVGEIEKLETFALDQLERIAREADACRISLMFSPPRPLKTTEERIRKICVDRRFLDKSYDSHNISITSMSLENVRKRYRRYCKRYRDDYCMTILEGSNLPHEIEETYRLLHIKDAGGEYRPKESFRAQGDLVRNGEAIWVVARRRATDNIAGMLLLCLGKGAAYDASVAVDPDFQPEFVSHLMKWKAIETMIERGTSSYELGQVANNATYEWQPSEKDYGISFFKNGWARGEVKRVLQVEKILSDTFLAAQIARKYDELKEYFCLGLQD